MLIATNSTSVTTEKQAGKWNQTIYIDANQIESADGSSRTDCWLAGIPFRLCIQIWQMDGAVEDTRIR